MNDHHGALVCRSGSYEIIDCLKCGFKHVYPLPTEQELENIYQNDYYTKEKLNYIESHQRDYKWWMQTYTNRLENIKKFILSSGLRLLDVGSGPGLMLQAATNSNWDAVGIEPNSVAADYSRSSGCNVVEDFLNQNFLPTLGKFDAIHSSEVLEHIRDPISMLEIMKSLLKPGGVVCIVVPNDFNPLQNVLVKSKTQSYWWVAPPHHLNYFSHSSLSKLVESIGLDVVTLTSTFPIEFFLAMGENYVGDDMLGSICHNKRKNIEILFEEVGCTHLLDQIYQKFAELEIGREIILIARKRHD